MEKQDEVATDQPRQRRDEFSPGRKPRVCVGKNRSRFSGDTGYDTNTSRDPPCFRYNAAVVYANCSALGTVSLLFLQP